MEVSWIIFIVFAYFIWASFAIFDKYFLNGKISNPFSYTIISGLYFLVLLCIIPIESMSFPSLWIVIAAILSGIFYILLILTYFKSLKTEEASRMAPLYQLTPLFVLVLSSIFLGERLLLHHYIGFALLVGGGALVSARFDGKKLSIGKGIYYALLSAFFAAVQLIFIKIAYSGFGLNGGFMWIRLGSLIAVIPLIAVAAYRKSLVSSILALTTKMKLLLLGKITLDIIALYAFSYAFLKGPASLIAAVGESVYPASVFLLALFVSYKLPFILKEQTDRKTIITKSIAILLVMAGLLVIS